MVHFRLTHALRLLTWLMVAAPWVACDPGPELPRVSELRVRRLTQGRSAEPWPVTIRGQGLATSTRHPLRFELLRQRPAAPPLRVALQRLRLGSGGATAVVPAGTAPGEYRLKVFRGARGRLTRHWIQIRRPQGNLGYPVLAAVEPSRPAAGEGGRVIITGANLEQPVLVTLHGPQRRMRRRSDGGGPARTVGRKVAIPFKPSYRKMPITELKHLTSATPTRLVALLPRRLEPGRYFVQVYTDTHRGNKPERVLVLGARLGTGQQLWGGIWLGLLLLLGVTATVALAGRTGGRRARLASVIGVLALCAAALVVLL